MATERARQKRLERKRRNREQKRRLLRAEAESASCAPPPMSLMLKRFAQPLLDRLPEGASADDWKLVLTFAAMVWNAADEAFSERVLALGRDLFEALDWGGDVAEQLQLLQRRKAEHFGREQRKVAGVDVENDGGIMHVMALSVLA